MSRQAGQSTSSGHEETSTTSEKGKGVVLVDAQTLEKAFQQVQSDDLSKRNLPDFFKDRVKRFIVCYQIWLPMNQKKNELEAKIAEVKGLKKLVDDLTNPIHKRLSMIYGSPYFARYLEKLKAEASSSTVGDDDEDILNISLDLEEEYSEI